MIVENVVRSRIRRLYRNGVWVRSLPERVGGSTKKPNISPIHALLNCTRPTISGRPDPPPVPSVRAVHLGDPPSSAGSTTPALSVVPATFPATLTYKCSKTDVVPWCPSPELDDINEHSPRESVFVLTCLHTYEPVYYSRT